MSLRGRLLGVLVALAAAGLLILTAISYAALRSYLLDRVDQQVISAVAPVSHDLLNDQNDPFPGGPGPGGGRGRGGPPMQLPEGTYGAIRDSDGDVVKEVTRGYETTDTPELPDDLPLSEDREDAELVTVDGYRVIAAAVPSGGDVVVAVPLDEVNSTLSRLLLISAIVSAVVLLGLAAAAWWLIRLGLAPLERMGRTAGAIAAGDYSKRVEPDTPRTEVGRLGSALNAMLGQIERAFAERRASEDKLRRFLSDASHELRTPLSSIRGYAELFRIGAAQDEADREKAMARIESEAARMGVLVEDLLMLARLDEQREVVTEDVDLTTIARDAADAAQAAAPDRAITVAGDSAVEVEGDPDRLRQVVDNLVRNALVHTPAGTPVELRTTRNGAEAVLEVRDHGPGLPGDDPDALFGRFWRAETGRTRGRAGAGLGLAIVAGIIEAHGGTVHAENAPEGGARFLVRLPITNVAGERL